MQSTASSDFSMSSEIRSKTIVGPQRRNHDYSWQFREHDCSYSDAEQLPAFVKSIWSECQFADIFWSGHSDLILQMLLIKVRSLRDEADHHACIRCLVKWSEEDGAVQEDTT